MLEIGGTMTKFILSIVLITLSTFVISTNAGPLCIKYKTQVPINNDYYIRDDLLGDYFECPWYREEIMKRIADIARMKQAESNRFISLLTLFIGQSLLKNDSAEDRALGGEYINYSRSLTNDLDYWTNNSDNTYDLYKRW